MRCTSCLTALRFPPPAAASSCGSSSLVQAAIGVDAGLRPRPRHPGPSFAAHTPRWLDAAPLDDLSDGGPTPVTLRIARQDGYRQVVDRRVVYLSRDAAGVLRARLDLHAPGLPHPLRRRVQPVPLPVPRRRLRRRRAGGRTVRRRRRCAGSRPGSPTAACSSGSEGRHGRRAPRLARLADRLSRAARARARRAAAGRHRLDLHHRQRRSRCSAAAVRDRRRPGDVLRAVAGAGLRQPALPDRRRCRSAGCCAACTSGAPASWSSPRPCTWPASSGRRPTRRRAKSPGSPAWCCCC